MLGGTFFSAISQILLKQSANSEYKNPLLEYLNWRVILAYVLFFGILLLNTYCYTKVDMRYGPVIDTAAYVFVLILSRLILKEKITKGKIIGNLIIIAGIRCPFAYVVNLLSYCRVCRVEVFASSQWSEWFSSKRSLESFF